MAIHDVSHEARGFHGRWVRIGERPIVSEARGPFTMSHQEVAQKVAELPKGKRMSLNGVVIDNIPSKGLRVRVGGESHFYDTPLAVAQVVLNKHHGVHSEKVQVRERAIRKIAQPEPPPAPPTGPHGVPAIPIVVDFARTRYPGRSAENDKTIRLGVKRGTDIQRQYVPDIINNTTVAVQTKPGGRAHTFANYASSGRVPTLTNEAIMAARGTGEPPKVMTGIKGHMNVKPDIFVASNSQATLKRLAGSWWVPTNTDKYSLSDTVIAHEIGHGVHGQLNNNGIQGFGWNPVVTNDESQQFWQDLADAIDVPRPTLKSQGNYPVVPGMSEGARRVAEASQQPAMDLEAWFRKNTMAIRQRVSEYGGKKNVRELTAELWAEYTMSDHPRPAAKFYGDFVMSKIGAAKGVPA